MTLNSLLTQKKMTKYQLSKKSGVPQTTVIDICSGKTCLEKVRGGDCVSHRTGIGRFYGKPAPRSDGEDSGEAQFL